MTRRLSSTLGVLLLAAAAVSAGTFEHAGDGAPFRAIVLPADAAPAARLAAEQLRDYVRRVCGVELPLIPEGTEAPRPAVHVGVGEWARSLGVDPSDWAADEYLIRSGPGYLLLAGRDHAGPPIHGSRNPWHPIEAYNPELELGAFGSAGSLMAVNRFLEDQLGVRWYWPGETGTVAPEERDVRVPALDVRRKPAFGYRYVWLCDFVESERDALWYKQLGFGGDYPVTINHSFMYFQPYKDTHPEYFALVDGQRDTTNLCTSMGFGHLCLSNPAVAAQWVQDIRAFFDANPEQGIYPIVPNDGLHRICECPGCQADLDPADEDTGKFSNHVWKFIDRVAAEVAKTHPDKFVGGLSYEKYADPPSALERLHPNTAVMLCNWRAMDADPARARLTNVRVDAWRALTDHLYFWDYYLFTWRPWENFPVFFPNQIADDLRRRFRLGSGGEFIEAESWGPGLGRPMPHAVNFPGMQHLPLYLTGRLYWEPDADVHALLDEYYRLFYGPAEEPMRAFWTLAAETWEARARSGTENPLDHPHPLEVFGRAMMDRASGLLAEAVARTPGDSAYRARVETVQREFEAARAQMVRILRDEKPELAAVRVSGADPFAPPGAQPQKFCLPSGEEAPVATWMQAGWDRRFLYLRLACFEPAMDKLVAQPAGGRDAANLWEDDCIELFFVDPERPNLCRQYIVNANGALWDGERTGPDHSDETWNGEAVFKATKEEGRWRVDAKIPWSDLGVAPAPGVSLRMNAYRTRRAGGQGLEFYDWSPIFTMNHFAPDRFGMVTLAGK